MKKLIVISMIVAGALSSAGTASAASIAADSYTGWQHEAFSGSDQ